MLEKANYYPGQKSNEEVLMFIRRHIVAYAKWMAILACMLIVPAALLPSLFFYRIIFFTDASKYWYIAVFGVYSMLILAVFLTSWIDYYLDVTIISKEHLINIRQDDLFTRTVAEQSLLRVQDVSARTRGFWQDYFRFGTVYVETAGEQPNFRMVNIPKPQSVASFIMKIHEELIEQHELGEELADGIGMDVIKPLKKKVEQEKIEAPKTEYEEVDFHIEPTDEEKIITIQKPKKERRTNKREITNQVSQKIEKIESPTKKEEPKDFEIEKSWIRQTPKYQTEPKKEEDKDSLQSSSGQDIPKDTEGEIKEGEDIKF